MEIVVFGPPYIPVPLRGFSGVFWGWRMAGGVGVLGTLLNSCWRKKSNIWRVFCHLCRNLLANQCLRIKSWHLNSTEILSIISVRLEFFTLCHFWPLNVQKKTARTIHLTHFSFSQWCVVGCVLVCSISSSETVIPEHVAVAQVMNSLFTLLCSKLRHLAVVLQITVLYFWGLFFLDVTQLFKTVATADVDSVTHIWFKNNEPRVLWLPTHGGCLQCNLFLTFDPVPVASYWGYSTWHNAIRSISNL